MPANRIYPRGIIPANFKDMAGERCGMLAVLSQAPSMGNKSRWLCKCDCGKETVISGDSLRQGQYSCGCTRIGGRTHGMTGTRTYRIWKAMTQRCYNRKNPNYERYGARGITICKRWHRFENFLSDMGTAPNGLSIERKNNNRGYTKNNCCWATDEQQAQNRSTSVYVDFEGEKTCVAEAARRMGVKATTLYYRLKSAVHKKDIRAPVGRSVLLTFQGETLNITAWGKRLGIDRATIGYRHKKGWPIERILQGIVA